MRSIPFVGSGSNHPGEDVDQEQEDCVIRQLESGVLEA